MGFTGVAWILRRVVRLATELRSGARSAPMLAASTAWADLGGSFAEAADETAKVMALLSENWSGAAAQRALTSIGEMNAWLLAVSTASTATATQARVCATAYSVADVAMPTEAEIAAAHAMKAAGAAAPGVAGGLTAAGETMERALDIRAAAAMHAYEAACSPVAVEVEFAQPPVVALNSEGEIRAANAPSGPALSGTPSHSGLHSGDALRVVQAQAVTAVPGAGGGTVSLPVSPAQLAATAQGTVQFSHAAHGAAGLAGLVVRAAGPTSAGVLSAPTGVVTASSASPVLRAPQPATATAVTAANVPAGTAAGLRAVGSTSGASPDSAMVPRGEAGSADRSRTAAAQASSLARLSAHAIGREPAVFPGAPPVAGRFAPHDDDEVRVTPARRPVDPFDSGASGRLVCPPVIGAHEGDR